MTIQDFVSQNNGRALDYDGSYGAQCMDLINYWARALGKRQFMGNANNVAGQNHDQWRWVANTPSGVPAPGSIVCFAANANYVDVHTGQFGHVDLFLSGNTASFTGFDQNWSGVQHCQQVHHSYHAVLGWLEPLGAPAPAPSTYMVQAIRNTNVRTAPSTSAAVTSLLLGGTTFVSQGQVAGENVTQNGVTSNMWEHSTLGHFVWSGNTKKI